jgi:glutamate/tyrosine decarboxylase-like PLP-dependent enzyme
MNEESVGAATMGSTICLCLGGKAMRPKKRRAEARLSIR